MSKYKTIEIKELPGKFEHVNFNETRSDDQLLATNYKFLAISWTAGSHSQIVLVEKKNPRPIEPNIPKIISHPQKMNDIRWSPFHSNLLASPSDDGTIKLWKIPEEGLSQNLENEDQKFIEHTKRVNLIKFHPSCGEIAATCSGDNIIKAWNIESGTSYSTMKIPESFGALDWNYDGSIIGGCKSEVVFFYDPRSGKEIGNAKGSDSKKFQKMFFVSKENFVTVGFDKEGRELKLFDIKNLGASINTLKVDNQ